MSATLTKPIELLSPADVEAIQIWLSDDLALPIPAKGRQMLWEWTP